MAIEFYKVSELPAVLQPSSIYYIVELLEGGLENEEIIIHRLFVTTKSIPAEAIPLNAVTKNEFISALNNKLNKPNGTIEQYVRGDGTLGSSDNMGLNPLSVLYVNQDLSLEHQAIARENIGVTTSFYTQKWIYDEVSNPSKEFHIDFTPTQIVWCFNTNSPIWIDEGDFEIIGNSLKILTGMSNGSIIRLGYYHE